ncbi:MAG TPA: S1/P1 nuclease [Allosphingosinicella sp.]|jgi:hypothetical protein|nr:S1/P1 nuclease [Allosphingosinicella sp.]
MIKRLLVFLAFALLLPSPALAWWDYGHRSVGTIAWAELNPQAKREIAQLIAHSRELDTPECRVRTLADAAVWPDCIRAYHERFNYSFSWHYQDLDICRPFDIKANCKDGNCITAQIARNLKLLADKKLPMRERLMALAFVAHFLGDLHQPLHVGEHGDAGGNQITASYGAIGGKTNLHEIWDGLLAERAISSPPGGPVGILGQYSPDQIAAMRQGKVEDWTRQTWALSREDVYNLMFPDPCKGKQTGPVAMDEAMTQKLIPIVRLQIVRGGVRLAKLLNETLGGETPTAA